MGTPSPNRTPGTNESSLTRRETHRYGLYNRPGSSYAGARGKTVDIAARLAFASAGSMARKPEYHSNNIRPPRLSPLAPGSHRPRDRLRRPSGILLLAPSRHLRTAPRSPHLDR